MGRSTSSSRPDGGRGGLQPVELPQLLLAIRVEALLQQKELQQRLRAAEAERDTSRKLFTAFAFTPKQKELISTIHDDSVDNRTRSGLYSMLYSLTRNGGVSLSVGDTLSLVGSLIL